MAKKDAFCIRVATETETRGFITPEHDKRKKEYMEKMRNSDNISDRSVVADIRDELSWKNIYYELAPGKTLESYRKEAERRYTESIHQKPQKSTLFIRPCMLNVKKGVTIDQITEMGKMVKEETGMTLLAAYYHADEGHYKNNAAGQNIWIGNYHIHAYFLSQHLEDHIEEYSYFNKKGEEVTCTNVVKAGRTCRNINYSKLQDILAPVFGMERGESRNNDPKAFLHPRKKFANTRSTKAAQIIKAENKLKELKLSLLKLSSAQDELVRTQEKIELQNNIIANNQSIINNQQAILETQRTELQLLNKQLQSFKNSIPTPYQSLKYIKELKKNAIDDIQKIVAFRYKGKLKSLKNGADVNHGDYYRLNLEMNGEQYCLIVYLETGVVFLDYNNKLEKHRPFPELAEYLRASITPEMRQLLDNEVPLKSKPEEKKEEPKRSAKLKL